jgi:hypothetical protein
MSEKKCLLTISISSAITASIAIAIASIAVNDYRSGKLHLLQQ